MGAYILRRVLLMIPTILGIMAISFAVIQFAPGGPVEQVIAKLSGQGGDAGDRLGGGGGDGGAGGGVDNVGEGSSKYRGAQGLDPQFIAKLEKQFGFDKPPLERFGMMLWDYARFDFGDSYFRDISVLDADPREDAGVDLARPVDHAALLPDLDPARHPQGGEGRLGLRRLDQRRRHHRLRHPGLPVRHPADGAVCRRLVLRLVPAARTDLGELGPAVDRRQDPRLSLAPGAAADRHGAVGIRHHDAAHQELVPRRDPQAICDHRPRQGPVGAAGALRPRLPQCDADRDRRLSRAPSSRPSSPARC